MRGLTRLRLERKKMAKEIEVLDHGMQSRYDKIHGETPSFSSVVRYAQNYEF